jgi:hypothetical protein
MGRVRGWRGKKKENMCIPTRREECEYRERMRKDEKG